MQPTTRRPRRVTIGWAALVACALGAACEAGPGFGESRRGGAGAEPGTSPPSGGGAGSGEGDGRGDGSGGEEGKEPGAAGASGGPGAGVGGEAGAPRAMPRFDKLVERCKLISDRNLDAPTRNDTHRRANVRGTDLGIPVVHGNDFFLFFGDTAGAQGIWPLGPESLPDAVGYAAVPAAQVRQDPATLCENLRFLLTGGRTGTVEGDFAGVSMTPPPGRAIGEFVRNPSGPRGANAFPTLPGDFEVPSGAFSYGGAVYVFYTIIHHDPFEMRGSYLARWSAPSRTGQPSYEIQYHVDQRFDANGALRGDFVNIAPVVHGDWLYLYGTGKYRASPVHLARKRLATLATAGGFERFDAGSRTWVAANAPGQPVVAQPSVGELSVQYYPELRRWVMLDQEASAGNRVVARFADAPEGPFGAPVTVASMADPAFLATYCCVNGDCLGARLFHCDRAGFYGTYLFPDAAVAADGSFALTFTMSTWDPYNVALMTATFR